MLRHIFKILLLAFAAWLLTGPLALLQLGAWGWMVASYTQESSFEQAIIETFGNERPCDLCHAIDAIESRQSSNSPQHSDTKDIKLMLGLGRSVKLDPPTATFQPYAGIVCKPENALTRVPTPPPRAA